MKLKSNFIKYCESVPEKFNTCQKYACFTCYKKFTRNITQTGRKACAEYVRNVRHGENLACSKSYIVQEGMVYDRVEQHFQITRCIQDLLCDTLKFCYLRL